MRRQILKNFLIIFFPLLLIALVVTVANLYREKSYEVESISKEANLVRVSKVNNHPRNNSLQLRSEF
ncbi:MAG: hypothetical protein PWP62_2191 [Eubacteriaceae bacterium]|nr:hypothetical protein [Eubacteriaceae bacterium]MDK2961539.1 hypothetical protein [Eubacteriaceae bacterium]